MAITSTSATSEVLWCLDSRVELLLPVTINQESDYIIEARPLGMVGGRSRWRATLLSARTGEGSRASGTTCTGLCCLSPAVDSSQLAGCRPGSIYELRMG